MSACDACLRRTALIASLAGWIDLGWKRWNGPGRLLAVEDDELLDLAGDPAIRDGHAGFDAAAARRRASTAGLSCVCRCSPAYPPLLRELPDPPAVLHVAGNPGVLAVDDGVAIVGARRASEYGLEVARALGRSLAVAGVPVVSGLALGIDSASHAGAVSAASGGAGAESPRGAPIAVLGGGADVPYPPSSRWLYTRIRERGAVVSELPPGTRVRRWMFPARNRIIAALARATVVVEAAERSGSLITADLAIDLGRAVGAVPGRITTQTARGSNGLLAAGAAVIAGPQDVLDLLAEHGIERTLATGPELPEEPLLRRLLEAIDDGRATVAALTAGVAAGGELSGAADGHAASGDATGDDANAVLRGLAELETRGLVRRAFGGRYVRVVA